MSAVVAWLGVVAVVPAARGSEGTDFHLQVTSSVTYDDNLHLTPPGGAFGERQDDLILAVFPGLEVASGDPELTYWELTATEGFFVYTDSSDENDQLAVVQARAGTAGARSRLDFSGSYQQLQQNTRDIRDLVGLVRRDRLDAGLDGEYEFSPKTSVDAGIQFLDEDFKDERFADLSRTRLPVNVYYEVSSRVDLSAGYRYQTSRRRNIAGARYTDHFLNLGARGEFSPKVSGRFKVGHSHRRTRTAGSFDTLGFEGTLRWEATVKVALEAEVSRDFDSSGLTGEPVRITDGALRGTYAIASNWSAGGSVRLERVSYVSGRSDRLTVGRLSLNYQPQESFGFSAVWDYQFNHSNAAYARFEQNRISVSGSYRY